MFLLFFYGIPDYFLFFLFIYFFSYSLFIAKSHYLHYLQYGLDTSLDNTIFYLQYNAYWLHTLLTIQDSIYNLIHTYIIRIHYRRIHKKKAYILNGYIIKTEVLSKGILVFKGCLLAVKLTYSLVEIVPERWTLSSDSKYSFWVRTDLEGKFVKAVYAKDADRCLDENRYAKEVLWGPSMKCDGLLRRIL